MTPSISIYDTNRCDAFENNYSEAAVLYGREWAVRAAGSNDAALVSEINASNQAVFGCDTERRTLRAAWEAGSVDVLTLLLTPKNCFDVDAGDLSAHERGLFAFIGSTDQHGAALWDLVKGRASDEDKIIAAQAAVNAGNIALVMHILPSSN